MANATYQLTITCTHFQQFVENTLCFIGDTADGTQTYQEGQDLIDAFTGGPETEWRACLPPTVRIDRYSTRCLLPSGPSLGAHKQVVNSALVGTSGTAAQSENLCPVMNLIPPMGIKSQGRVYMPCIAKEDINDNVYTGGYITAMNALFDELIAGISNSSIVWKLAIYSKKNGTSARAISHSLSAAIGFQGRRRRPI